MAAALVPLVLAVLPAEAQQQPCPGWKPAVTWNTYLGGGTLPDGGVSTTNSTDELEGVATNALGEVFVTGRANSVAFPSTTGLPATGATGSGYDALVAKFSADGTRMEWVRVFGGLEDESGLRVALATSGDVYVVGTTESSVLVQASGASRTVLSHQGGKDAFLAKLTAAGELSWFMFLGSGADDEGLGLDVSPDDKTVYVVGRSKAALENLGTRYGTRGDSVDGFIVKVDVSDPLVPKPMWNRILGSTDTRFGFDADDSAYAVVARENAVFVGGIVGSIMLDVPSAAVRQEFHRGDDDGFVAKLNALDASFLWFTNVGHGNGTTSIRDILVQSSGGIAAVGTTDSPDFITRNTAQGRDAFVFLLDAEGNDRNKRRRLIGSGDEQLEGHAALDSMNNIVIGGRTGSGAFASQGFDNFFEESTDGFVMMLDGVDLSTRWASYVGGVSSTPEEVRGVAIDSQGRLTLSGYSSAGPANFFRRDVGAERSPRGGVDGFIFRVVLDPTAPLKGTVTAGLSQGRITASWEGFSEPESFIDRYEWAIRDSNGVIVQDFAPVEGTTATADRFTPQLQRPYFVKVRATNVAGCTSEEAESTEVVSTSPPVDGGNDDEPLSPLGWGCGSTGGGSALGVLALTALTLGWGRRRVLGSAR